MNTQAVHGMLGLSMRAGQITLGVEMAANAVRSGKMGVALIDENASDNAKKRMQDTAKYYQVPVFELPGGMLDQACGKSGRVAAAIKKGGIAEKIIQLMTSADTVG